MEIGKKVEIRTVTQDLSNRFRNMAVVCACFVVAIHTVSHVGVNSFLIRAAFHDGIFRVAVPFFFFSSGFFLVTHLNEKKWWLMAIWTRLKTLLIPYLIFNLLYLLLHVIVDNSLSFGFFEICKSLGLYPLAHPCLAPLWYIRSLFILILFSPILVVLMRGREGVCVLLGMYLLYLILVPWEGGGGVLQGNAVYLFRKFFTLHGLFYFWCGIAYRRGVIDVIVGKKQAWCCLGIGVSLIAGKYLMQAHCIPGYWYVGNVAVCFLLVGIFNLVSGLKGPTLIVSSSFPIYLVHMFVVGAVYHSLKLILGEDFAPSVVVWIAITVFCIIMSWLCVVMSRRYLPRMSQCLYGGR